MLSAGFVYIAFDDHRMTALAYDISLCSDGFFCRDSQVMDGQIRCHGPVAFGAFTVGKSAHCSVEKNSQDSAVGNVDIIMDEWRIRDADSPAVILPFSFHAERSA